MKQIAAYALLSLAGNENPSAADVAKLLKEAGVAAEQEQIDAMITKFGEKKYHENVDAGLAKMKTMGGAAAPVAAAGGAANPVEEEKKEEPEDVDMGGLFGDDDEY